MRQENTLSIYFCNQLKDIIIESNFVKIIQLINNILLTAYLGTIIYVRLDFWAN